MLPAAERPLITVVGGANADIGGIAAGPLAARDSNPGRVEISFGGVGRNIAHNLCLLGARAQLLTALGEDEWADRIERHCASIGLRLIGHPWVMGARTGTYLFIAGPDGDMALAVSDMAVLEHLSPENAEKAVDEMNASCIAAVDANLREDTLWWIARNVRRPLFADAVSAAKCARLKPILPFLHTLKPNRLEAETLSGVPIRSEEDLPAAADALLETGLKRVVISLGAEGVYAADGGGRWRIPACPARVVNATGAGDAFMAALLMAEARGLPTPDAARIAAAAAAIAAESRETINPALTWEAAEKRMNQVFRR